MNFIPEDFLIGDVTGGRFRHLVFASREQLEILSRAKTWYLDATFKVIADPFKQLFSVHAFIKSGTSVKQIPLMFAIMSRRKRKDYRKVFQCLNENLPNGFCMTQAVCDFEAGMWQGFREIFPAAKVQGCAFHWGQAVFRKVKSLGLEPAYRGDDGTYKLIRKLPSLPMIPANEIRPLFDSMRERHAVNESLQDLFAYIDATWLSSNVWAVPDWCVFGRAVRTNNDVEGWHHRLNARAGRANLQFYLLIKLLYQETDLVRLQVRLVSEGKLTRMQRKSTKDIQSKIFALWKSYCDGENTPEQLLRRVARLNL